MDNASYIYNPETLISPHTNRPVTDVEKTILPIFWCDLCQVRLRNVQSAIQHLGGRLHRARTKARDNPLDQTERNTSKRKNVIDSSKTVTNEPVAKKLKVQSTKTEGTTAKPVKPDPNLSCEDCNLVFASAVMAIQHFKGKRHISAVNAKLKVKQNQTISNWQNRDPSTQTQRGRGRGGRGQGRNNGGSRGAAAGQLLRALNNFYCPPADTSLGGGATFNSWMNPSGDTQRNDQQPNFNVASKPDTRNYETPQYLNDNSGPSEEYFPSDGAQTDGYHNNTQSPSMNYYDNSVPVSNMGGNTNFNSGSGNYFTDY